MADENRHPALGNEQDSPTVIETQLDSYRPSLSTETHVDGSPTSLLQDRILLASLPSWNRAASPPDSTDNPSQLLRIEHTRTPETTASNPGTKPPVADIIARQLADGYTLTRYRTVTGETTAAIMRGPLVPAAVPRPLPSGPALPASSGADLQFVDPDVDMVDATYASAWQLGRKLAADDAAFTMAVARLRRDTLAPRSGPAIIPRRFGGHAGQRHATATATATASPADNIDIDIDAAAAAAAIPSNADYATVRKWILAKLRLASVPATYLVTGASDNKSIPPETLRFVHVDANWAAALVDGSLSLGSHTVAGDTEKEHGFRSALTARLHADYAGAGEAVPVYGFFVRSQLLVRRHGRVEILCIGDAETETAQAVVRVVAQRVLGLDTLLCLVDRAPPWVPVRIEFVVSGDGVDSVE
ncbi:hypothetical protein B0T24DRAFT_718268 [Lasiosphaeria ovina]|uniref:Uncharacterized protein n=1 Tax=Lasiosphaeria ovina TaxID=92902 RepID=A0AAE0NA64_9PEZI|nr:hypothetical protein B0T24DRAFT_718268 [Lasiosphaeria ovina]